MSQNESNNNTLNQLFQDVKRADIEPSPYLRTRVLAHLREEKKPFFTVTVWKSFFATSMMALVVVCAYTLSLWNQVESNIVARESYVIHVNFSENDLAQVAHAEVVLPEDVSFVSKKGLVEGRKSLRLPIDVKAIGRGKLPFVVTAKSDGEKEILVRLLNEDNQLVREQVMKFKFARKDDVKAF